MRLGSRTAGVLALVPEIGERLGIRVPGSDDYSDSSGRFRLFEAISSLLRDTSEDVHVVLILEDVHWADASSLALLEHVVDSVRAARTTGLVDGSIPSGSTNRIRQLFSDSCCWNYPSPCAGASP